MECAADCSFISRRQTAKNRFLTLTFFTVLLFNSLLLVDLVRMVIGSESFAVKVAQYVIYLSVFAFSAFDYFVSKSRLKKPTIIFVTVFAFLILFSFVVDSNNLTFAYQLLPFFAIRIIPSFYLASNIKETKHVTDALFKWRYIWLIYSIIGVIYVSSHSESTYNMYSMNFGYNLFLPACLFFVFFLKKRNPVYFLYFLFECFCILYRGSRGPLLCIALFVVFSFLFSFHGKKKRKIIVSAGIISSLLLVSAIALNELGVVNFGEFLSSSRTLYFIKEDFFHDSGRNGILSVFLEKINEHPLAFRGMYSDRIYYANITGSVVDSSNYPHNLVVELLFHYGYVLTILLIVAAVVFHFSSIWKNKRYDFESKNLLYMLFLIGVVSLFFSGSYLEPVYVYLYLGFLFALRQGKKNENLLHS